MRGVGILERRYFRTTNAVHTSTVFNDKQSLGKILSLFPCSIKVGCLAVVRSGNSSSSTWPSFLQYLTFRPVRCRCVKCFFSVVGVWPLSACVCMKQPCAWPRPGIISPLYIKPAFRGPHIPAVRLHANTGIHRRHPRPSSIVPRISSHWPFWLHRLFEVGSVREPTELFLHGLRQHYETY